MLLGEDGSVIQHGEGDGGILVVAVFPSLAC